MFLAVNNGDSKDKIEKFWKEKGFEYTAVVDGAPICGQFGVRAFPTNLIVGKDGKIAWRSTGFNERELRRELGKAMGKREG